MVLLALALCAMIRRRCLTVVVVAVCAGTAEHGEPVGITSAAVHVARGVWRAVAVRAARDIGAVSVFKSAGANGVDYGV
jgi:hypothetical protein